ncbi:MAG: M36 family metallopeptidase, partial [Rubricoccaceae bacterium]|nr:M36 family metallopeptidase [Rubricoccaceae bacterium]
ADAADAADRYLQSVAAEWFLQSGPTTDGAAPTAPGAGYFRFVPESARVVYFATEDGDVRLAWDVALEGRDHQHYITARVDALDGTVLDYSDLVDHDHWGTATGGRIDHAPSYAPVAPASARGGAEYGVYPLPVESPNHGDREIVVEPADVTYSPLGWHDTGTDAYTITRGNNAHAYTDTDNDGAPDVGGEPDGGPGLSFLFPLDLSDDPSTYADAAVTNLFYWNNLIHDVTAHHGFDAASGNFQVNNFGDGGLGNDDVRAEAQDGGGRNNANFFTPGDGARPRMQMFLWDGPTPLEVTAPAEIAGAYNAILATFGPAGSPDADMMGSVVSVDDGTAVPDRGCEALTNGADLAGNIALIQRGDCEFGTKVLNAENAGAIGAIVYNCEPGSASTTCTGEEILAMGPGVDGASVTIPSYFVAQSTGEAMLDHMPAPGVEIAVIADESVVFDGDFDNGIIAHEYAHGISNRLVGGASNVSCLNLFEQMGEGWSDLYGVMMTMREGDTGETPRGVGTYVSAQPLDGVGIRAAPYSTDFAINDFTYADTRGLGLGQQHAVGHVWATAVWEATWELVNAHGFDADLYDADGTAGNQVMFRLMTEGMKSTNCNPTFVDARDGILEADTLLYDGAYSELLWTGFARRGLGYSAFGGNPADNNDNFEAFDLPPVLSAAEDDAAPAAFRLSAAAPNPHPERAALTLEVARTQPVRGGRYAALGRRVALLHDGELAGGVAHRLSVEAAGLASGTSFVRVSGEGFAATERLTLLD